MKKIIAIAIFPCCLLTPYFSYAVEIPLAEAEYDSPLEQVVILEPTMRPNKAYHLRCTVSNAGKAPIKVAFNVLGTITTVPARYSLLPQPFSSLGNEAELESYSTYQWTAEPINGASPDVQRQRISFRVFDPHHSENLQISDCYAVSITKA